MTMNVQWALGELQAFVNATERHAVDSPRAGQGVFRGPKTIESDAAILARAQVVEKILNRVIPGWTYGTYSTTSRWSHHRDTAIRAITELTRQDEPRENLGDNAPQISASDLHPWIWGGASSLWQSGHYGEAVEGAIRKLNAEMQNKVGRREVSETDLFNQAFRLEAVQPENPRLRRMTPDDSKTYKSVQRGAMSLAVGVFAGIRNPLVHEDEHDLTEQQALEYLASLSVLARWVDDATVERVEEVP